MVEGAALTATVLAVAAPVAAVVLDVMAQERTEQILVVRVLVVSMEAPMEMPLA
jgi:hypothetical protein